MTSPTPPNGSRPSSAPIPHDDPRLLALLRSYERYTGASLCAPEALFDAPFVVLSHGTEDPPILWYGNRAALALWERSFEDFVRMPSRETAEADLREVRERLLAEVRERGFSADYTGVRISSTGRRFVIERAFVWNVLDEHGARIGQAATFRAYRYVEGAGSAVQAK
jgi:hypothetical protein